MGFKLSWPKTKLQNVGAGDPTSTILIDGVPVEGVEEFIYLGSKQILMATADQTDVLRRIGFACSVMNSLQCMELQFSQYQHQSIPVPSTDKVCSALWYRNIHPLGRRHEYTHDTIHHMAFHMTRQRQIQRYLMYGGGLMSSMQRCFSDLVCQPSVTSYVIDAYLCLAMLHAWTLEYQHMMDALRLMIYTYKAES